MNGDREPDGGRREAVLVVDLGTTTTSAMVLAPDGSCHLLRHENGWDAQTWMPTAVFLAEDDSGSADGFLVGWPAFERRADDPARYRAEFKPDIGNDVPVPFGPKSFPVRVLVASVLRHLREAADVCKPTPRRLLVTVPAVPGPARRETMIAAGLEAGFEDVELLAEPLAAAHAPVVGGPWPVGTIVLVYDFGGGSFDTALVRIGEDEHQLLDQDGLPTRHGGRDVDAALRQDLTPAADRYLAADPARGGLRDRLERRVSDATTRLKHRLSAREHASVDITLGIDPQRSSRRRLREISDPIVAGTVDCCRALVERRGIAPAELGGVLLTGGSTRLPGVAAHLREAFGVEPRTTEDPVLAVVRGAARWALRIPAHATTGVAPSVVDVPLKWSFPQEEAVLVRWLVAPRDAFPAGAVLARVRLADGSLHDLRAPDAGRIVRLHAIDGERVYGDDWLVTVTKTVLPGEEASYNIVPWATRAAPVARDRGAGPAGSEHLHAPREGGSRPV
ncbi:Hsp70 family protein [Streptomyces poonensis]|uniref:Molecular chaperone DnaK n=1 Tax=Streptomyces poonensis TaxID=68255 RepID=A0A918PDP1_9ACTN|nr:Hsp70 family protein [Streptomyces poonensis]GGY99358.1 molecular chaperone DnaK [Streptomyces poonensis]